MNKCKIIPRYNVMCILILTKPLSVTLIYYHSSTYNRNALTQNEIRYIVLYSVFKIILYLRLLTRLYYQFISYYLIAETN